MAKTAKIPKPQGSKGVTKVRHPKSSVSNGGSIADVCKPRDASSDPDTFLGEFVEKVIPPELKEDTISSEPEEEIIEEPIEETVIEEIAVPEPEITASEPETEVFEPLPEKVVKVDYEEMERKYLQSKPVVIKTVKRARIVVKCALYTHRGRKVSRGQSFIAEDEEIYKYGNVDMFDIFYL